MKMAFEYLRRIMRVAMVFSICISLSALISEMIDGSTGEARYHDSLFMVLYSLSFYCFAFGVLPSAVVLTLDGVANRIRKKPMPNNLTKETLLCVIAVAVTISIYFIAHFIEKDKL